MKKKGDIMAKSNNSKGNKTSSKATQSAFRNESKNTTQNKGTTSSVKPDDNERRDGPGGE
ncbi:MAG: hypothetical protein K0R92_2367 [Lachnospiraceae bacterium]|jgi:hypothetical protein|nr:hypothetical protein [Lachnospiraceae bacterium]